MTLLASDIRIASRRLRRDPLFTGSAVITLGVGIGAAVVVFCIFNVTAPANTADGTRENQTAALMIGAVGVLLLLACINVSNLMLARTAARQRERTLRATLGAPDQSIIQQVLVESLILALLSTCLGLLGTAWVLPFIRTIETPALPLHLASFDHTAVLFALVLTIATGLVCGIAPAFHASRENKDHMFGENERIVLPSAGILQDALVTFQIALAVVLLVGAGLLWSDLVRLLHGETVAQPPGRSGLGLNAVVVGLFAVAAMGLAALGIYAVTVFSVARRKREFGVRMALGAAPSRIIAVTLGSGTRMVASGTGFGLVSALALAQILGKWFYQISPSDPLTYGAVSLLLILVATTAMFLAARRATKLDPRVAFADE